MSHSFINFVKSLSNRRIGVMFLLGFSSGLPLALTGNTLQAWMTVEGVDLKTIGIFTLVGIPYTLKFLWAPIMDRFVPPLLGRRRGWILICQVCLMFLILGMAFSSPKETPFIVAFLALLLAFISASQDIVIDAYRTDVLKEKERGFGVAVSVTGFRIAMLTSGAVAMILAQNIGWHLTYLFMILFLTIGIVGTLWGPKPDERAVIPKTLEEAIMEPLKDFFSRSAAWALLSLIVLYKLGDAFAGSLTTAFLIRGVGFSIIDIALINKGVGMATSILGALAGGALMTRLGLYRSLMFYGILQAISNLSFMILAGLGNNYVMMVFAVSFENLSGGMGTAAFVAFLMALCDQRFTATQYALLSALASLGRILAGPPSGFVVETVGWGTFFFITFLAALPGLILLRRYRETVRLLGKQKDNSTYPK